MATINYKRSPVFFFNAFIQNEITKLFQLNWSWYQNYVDGNTVDRNTNDTLILIDTYQITLMLIGTCQITLTLILLTKRRENGY